MRWSEWRRNEDHIEWARTRVWRSRRNDTNNNFHHGSSTMDTPILDQLEDLGLLQDVKDMLCREGPGAYRPMSSLERLSFNYPILLPPEEELKRLFSISKRKKLKVINDGLKLLKEKCVWMQLGLPQCRWHRFLDSSLFRALPSLEMLSLLRSSFVRPEEAVKVILRCPGKECTPYFL